MPFTAAVIAAVRFGGAELAMLVALAVLLLLLASLGLAETALTRMSRHRAAALADGGSRRARRLQRLVEHPERFINALLLLVLGAQTAQAAITTLLADRMFGSAGVVVSLFVNVAVVFVLTEAAPKTWAVQHTDTAALAVASPVAALTRLWPLRMLSRGLIGLTNVVLPGRGLREGPFVSEEELLAVAADAVEAEAIEHEERVLIKQIIDFGDTIVREVMVPRTDMVTVGSNFRVADVMEVVLLNGYSRLPVMGQSIDDIVGVAHAKDLMRAERDGRETEPVSAFMRPARYVPETKRVAELLREMQDERFHLAVVIDEYGGTAGLVALEDLIEELVGEIVDEYDREDPRVVPLPGGDLRVDARLSIDDANDVLARPLPEGEWDTVGGLMFSRLGKVAAVGDEVEVPGHRLRVERVQGRRIMRVRITPGSDDGGADDGDDDEARP
ncbi:MAG: HlyC/CorC family transporter [Actinobacteria bacterium]|nr:HlyC/CorC family transporter [Actinomycetota bacterium]